VEGQVNGVLFDAGGVLFGPVGGRWNPRYDFESIVQAHHPDIRPDQFAAANAEGQRVLDAGAPTAGGVTTVDRTDYHRAMLRVLGIDRPSGELLGALEAPPARSAVEVYADVPPVLARLAALGVGMAVVSDSWAGLGESLHRMGIGHYFAGVVVSAELGCRKPDPRMYAAGSQLLGLPPEGCLFIDDDPALVTAAVDLGYHGAVLARESAGAGVPGSRGVPVLGSLAELPPIVTGAP
jgi:putative hydrolase of the HAD superfamily